ncbi:hypothetical protein HN011_009023, partial [Eciton burchellii]
PTRRTANTCEIKSPASHGEGCFITEAREPLEETASFLCPLREIRKSLGEKSGGAADCRWWSSRETSLSIVKFEKRMRPKSMPGAPIVMACQPTIFRFLGLPKKLYWKNTLERMKRPWMRVGKGSFRSASQRNGIAIEHKIRESRGPDFPMKWTETTRTQCIGTRIVTRADIRVNPLGIHPLRREVDLYEKIVRFCHYADPSVDHYLSLLSLLASMSKLQHQLKLQSEGVPKRETTRTRSMLMMTLSKHT